MPVSSPVVPLVPAPVAYTPKHLAEQILTTRSALEGERKQVTVLFVDVVGFSTFAERLDPDDLHALMDGCFEILTHEVHRYEGTINQFTGDGIMALFGAPLTHEDHAVRALHAALGMQAALHAYRETARQRWGVTVQMRLGLNTGLVVVGRIGDDLRMDYTAQGDTTNLAARLQQMAPAGAIWVGETTYRVAREVFTWQALEPMLVKGKAEPVRVYELRGSRAVRGRFEVMAQRGLTRFVGRYPQLQRLLEAWDQAEQRQGQVVSVVGEAGIGKSRLVHEFKQRLTEDNVPYVEGSCFAYGDTISYLPFLDIVRGLCGLQGGETEIDAKRHIARYLTTLPLDLTTVVPYLHNLLSFSVDDALFAKLTADLVRRRTVEALKTLALAAARQRPLGLILEDVHWIDKASEEVLTAIVETMPTVPLLLVLVYRPEYLHAWANRTYHAQITLTRLPGASSAAMVRAILSKPYAVRVPLERLAPEQSAAMVQDLLGTTALPPALEQFVATRTDGNPLFVEELIRALLESGDLVWGEGGYRVARPLEALHLPATVQGVLLARIDRLHDDLKSVLQMASVIGRVFSYPVLEQVVPPGRELEQVLLELEDLEFLYPTSLAPQREYSFKHVLTQEAVYQTLLRPRREEFHERIGKAVEALYPDRLEEYYEVLAYHYARSGNKDKAVEYLDLANQKATRARAMEEAKGYFDAAMTLLDTLPETAANQRRRIALLVNQGEVMILLFKAQEYYDLLTRYEPLAGRVGDAGLLGAFYSRLGWAAYTFGDFAQPMRTLTQAAELCDAAGNAADAGLAYMILQWIHLWQCNYDQVITLKEEVLRTMAQRLHLRWYVWSLSVTAWAYTAQGRWQEAVQEGQQALRVGEEFADPSTMAFAAWILSMTYTSAGDLERARAYGEWAVQQAPTPADKVWSETFLAWAWCRAGEARTWVALMAGALATTRSGHHVPAELFQMLCLGEGYWLAGESDEATQTLADLLALAERCGARFYLGAAHRLLGEIALTTNPAQVAEPLAAPHFEQSIAILQQIGAENELALAYAGYGRLHQQQGNITLAREYLTRALKIFERLGTLGEPDRVRQALVALPAE